MSIIADTERAMARARDSTEGPKRRSTLSVMAQERSCPATTFHTCEARKCKFGREVDSRHRRAQTVHTGTLRACVLSVSKGQDFNALPN